jgi:hypothetical protein
MIWLVWASLTFSLFLAPVAITRDASFGWAVASALLITGPGAVLFFYCLARGLTQIGVLA